jgi:DNA-binding NarL/FixJ family response regulator
MILGNSNRTLTVGVILAHPNVLIRESIASVLEEAMFDVTGQARTEQELYELAMQNEPDIIVLDWEICEDRMIAIRRLREYAPHAKLVIFTRPQSAEPLLPAIQEGARGCLSVNLTPNDFIASLQVIANGEIVISQDMVSTIQQESGTRSLIHSKSELSRREREVLCLVATGATNREIALKLAISEHTAKVHLRNILNKLGLRNRQQAAAYAARELLSYKT